MYVSITRCFSFFPGDIKKSQQKKVVRKVTSTNHDGMICFCCCRLVKKLPSGRAFVCMDTKYLPQVLQQIFTSAVLSSRWHPVDISHVSWTRLFFHVVIWRVLNNNDMGFKNEKKRDCLCIYLPFSFVVVVVFFRTLRSNRQNSLRIGKTHVELARLASNWQDSFLIRKIRYGPHKGCWQLLWHLLTWSQNRTSLVRYLGQLFPHVCSRLETQWATFAIPERRWIRPKLWKPIVSQEDDTRCVRKFA